MHPLSRQPLRNEPRTLLVSLVSASFRFPFSGLRCVRNFPVERPFDVSSPCPGSGLRGWTGELRNCGTGSYTMKRPSGPRPADTERTPTHTHHFPSAQESPGRPSLPFPGFPLWQPNPSTRRRITRAARVRKPSAGNGSNVQKFPFSRSSSCVLYPRHTTHIRASAFHFSPAITIVQKPSYSRVFASFRIPLSDIMVQRTSVLCIGNSRIYSLSFPR